jgi:hypothetical protein
MKSIENKFAEALEALDKAGKRKRFDEASKNCGTIESKLNCAESILGARISDRFGEAAKTNNPLGLEDIEESKRAFPLLFGLDPKPATREAAPVRKNNGRVENFVEGSPFNEGRPTTEERVDPREAQVKNYMLTCKISEADARRVLGLAPKEVVALGKAASAEYQFARSIGISESEAMKLVNLTGGYKQVSR